MNLHQILFQAGYSSAEGIWMIQKATAMGNWWLAASSRWCSPSCMTSCAEIFGETSSHPGDSAPLQPRFGALQLLAFPKNKITFEWKRFQTILEIQENTTGQLMVPGRTVLGPKVPALKGTEVSLFYVQCFLYLLSCIFFNKCLYFLYYMGGYLPDRPRIFCLHV